MTLGTRLTHLCDGLLGASVVALALWTAVFHLALLLDWRRDPTAGVWLLALAAAAVVWRLARRRLPGAPETSEPVDPGPASLRLALAAVGVAAGVAAGAAVLDGSAWWGLWGAVVAVTAGGVALTLRARGTPSTRVPVPVPMRSVAAVLAVAAAFAGLSLLTQRPDADDVFVMNRATYTEEHAGELATRDTIFSDEVFRSMRPDDAPETAIEPLVGVVARFSPLTSPTVAYLLLAPAVSALGILALWRLLRTLGALAPAVATSLAALFLFLDGREHASLGNTTFGRAWQGKVIFVFVVVPLLWHHALRWSRDGERRSLAVLVAANVAGIGLTSTAAFVAPAVTVLGLLAGGWRRPARAAVGLAALLYPVLVTLAVALQPTPPAVAAGAQLPPGSGASADLSRFPPPAFGESIPVLEPVAGDPGGLEPAAQWYFVAGSGVGAALLAVAVLTAWLLVRDRAPRLALAVAPLAVFAGLLTSPALDLVDRVTDAASVVWRVLWVVPAPAAVGLLLAAPLTARLRGRRLPFRGLATLALAVVVAAAMLAFEHPVTARENRGARFGDVAWDLDPAARAAAERMAALGEPGDLAAVPERVGGALVVITTRVRPVNPRGDDLQGSHVVPGFHARERLVLSRAAERDVAERFRDDVRRGLEVLDIDLACTLPSLPADAVMVEELERAGFEVVAEDELCRYWRR